MTDAFRLWNPAPYEASPESTFKYPRPRPEVQLSDGAYPTNSWLENVITDRYPNPAQLPFFNCTPWYWAVDYARSSFVVDHCTTVPFTNTLTQGQILQIQNGYEISVSSPGNSGLTLTYHDDFCATFASTNFDAYPCRGSPSCDYILKQGVLEVNFGPYLIEEAGVVTFDNRTFVTTSRAVTTVNNADLLKTDPNKTISGVYYDGTATAPGITNVTATINSAPTQRGETSSISNVTITFKARTVSFAPIAVTPGVAVSGTLSGGPAGYSYTSVPAPSSNSIALLITNGTGRQWNFLLAWDDSNVYKLNTNFTETKEYKWFVYHEGVTVSVTDAGSVAFAKNGTKNGRVQLRLNEPLLPPKTAVIKKGSVTDFTSNLSGANLTATCRLVLEAIAEDRSEKILYMPEHWLRMSGAFPPPGTLPSIANFIYGNLYGLTLGDATEVLLNQSVLSNMNELAIFADTNANVVAETLLETANEDAERYIRQIPSSGPYQYGTIVGKMARIYSLFQVEGGVLDPTSGTPNGVTKSIYKLASESPQVNAPGTGILTERWLAGTNINAVADWIDRPSGFMSPQAVFQLLRDDIWGGVLTPSDYLRETFAGTPVGLHYANGNFGNSYYNDHHFHWGYFFYILTVFAKLGINYYTGVGVEGVPTKAYAPQILALLKDVVNPQSDAFGWKVRHKDWYAGHSWATGVSNDIQRQNESMGESCNCYYSAYHLCDTLAANPSVVEREKLLRIRDCALNALVMEILALHCYYLNGSGKTAINAFQGALAKTAGVGILLNNSKQCTTDWAPQPESHNGRMLGVYGIHFVPFNQLVKTTLTPQWILTAAQGTGVPGFEPYTTPAALVNTLCRFQEYIPVLAPNETAPKFVKEDGVRFGALGLKYLSFRSWPGGDDSRIALDPNGANLSYNSVHVAQEAVPTNTELFHQTDSLTNTYYWLAYNKYLKGASRNQLVSADVPGLSVNVEQPCGPAVTLSLAKLLEDSPAKCEGKIGVPLVYLQICLDSDNSEVAQSFFQIYDEFCYNNARARIYPDQKCCYLSSICPNELKLTRLTSDLNPALVTQGPGTTIHDKLVGTGFDPNTFTFYAILKLIFARILTGRFDLQYLTLPVTSLFYVQLLQTRFCAAYSEDILLNPIFAGMDSLFLA